MSRAPKQIWIVRHAKGDEVFLSATEAAREACLISNSDRGPSADYSPISIHGPYVPAVGMVTVNDATITRLGLSTEIAKRLRPKSTKA
jgi:hypothetical protein